MSRTTCLIFLAALATSPASAHVELEGAQAAIGVDYKAVFIVPHGCAGSPTIKLRVQIPEGVIATEAKPIDGWQVDTVKGHHRPVALPERPYPDSIHPATGALGGSRLGGTSTGGHSACCTTSAGNGQ